MDYRTSNFQEGVVSYDFVVWVGAQPLSNAHAASEFKRTKNSTSPGHHDPVPALHDFVMELTSVCPERGRPGGLDSPWIDSPLMDQANESIFYVRVDEHRAEDVAHLLESTVRGRNLVVFDPQLGELVPSAVGSERTTKFQLPRPNELEMHLVALLSEHIAAPWPMVGVIEHVRSGTYVQWMTDRGSLTLEVQGNGSSPEGFQLPQPALERLSALGFEQGEPNWRRQWNHHHGLVEEAVPVVTDVMYTVRSLPMGDGIAIQTFPAAPAE